MSPNDWAFTGLISSVIRSGSPPIQWCFHYPTPLSSSSHLLLSFCSFEEATLWKAAAHNELLSPWQWPQCTSHKMKVNKEIKCFDTLTDLRSCCHVCDVLQNFCTSSKIFEEHLYYCHVKQTAFIGSIYSLWYISTLSSFNFYHFLTLELNTRRRFM